MFSINDLDDDLTVGIDLPKIETENEADADGVGPAKLTPDSPTSQALWRVWAGEAVTVIDSPPGGGKSETVATVTAHLAVRADLRIVVAVPTRRAAVEISMRLAQQVPYDLLNFQVTGTTAPEGVFGGKRQYPRGGVSVRTLASCKRAAPEVDLLVVDEAYQCTFADVAAAGNRAAQVLMVGDPGQIGPVVTVDTTMWDRMRNAPHRRAPEAFAAREDCETVHIGTSYRLGQATVDAIAPLYDFPFVSGRFGRQLVAENGTSYAELESVEVESGGDPDNSAMLREVAKIAASYVGATRFDARDTGTESTVLRERDIAVVVSHNSQANVVSGMLGSLDCGDIVVGTADRLQGGQWSAVVALCPAAGYTDTSGRHMMALGRLCVMASRHTTHMTWVHDGAWRELFTSDGVPTKLGEKAMAVREALTVNDVSARRGITKPRANANPGKLAASTAA